MGASVLFLRTLIAAALAPLLVAWPVLCCCTFDCGGDCEQGPVALESTAGRTSHNPHDEQHDHDAHHKDSEGSGYRHSDANSEHDSGRPCSDHPGDRGCSCEKSVATLVKVDAGRGFDALSKSVCTCVPLVDSTAQRLVGTIHSYMRAVERAPPPSLSRFCVLRL